MKYRGEVKITAEYLKFILELPEEVDIKHVSFDAEREYLSVHLSSSEEVEGLTFKTGEGQAPRTADLEGYFNSLLKKEEKK